LLFPWAFADDVMLMANSIQEAQILLLAVEKYAAQLGFFLNPKKTELMISCGNYGLDFSDQILYSSDKTSYGFQIS
jgi:hypothetical protein